MTTIGTMSFKGFNLHQLKNVINQEKKSGRKKKLFIFLKHIENADIYQKTKFKQCENTHE